MKYSVNKKLSILFILLALFSGLRAQKISYYRSIGTNAIGIGGVLQTGSYGLDLDIEKKVGYQLNLLFSADYTQGKSGYSSFQIYKLNSKCIYEIFSFRNNFILSSGAGLYIGMEDLHSKVEEKGKEIFVFGAGITLRTEMYISKQICLFANATINKNFKSQIYNTFFQINPGIKILLL